jgi:cobalt-zinc-cadmium efflux system membrane fusion protein
MKTTNDHHLLRRLALSAATLAVPLALAAGCDDDSAVAAPNGTAEHDDHAGRSDEESGPDDHAGHSDEEAVHDDHAGHGDEGGGEEHADEVSLTAEAVERYGVRVAAVEARPLDAVVTAPARVGFNTEAMAHVGSLVQGRVAEIKVKLGDRVETGDVLLVVDSPELGQLQANHLANLSAVEAAAPAVELARDFFERAQRLYDETSGGGVTLNAVQDRQATLRAAERELAVAEADVTASANTLRLHGMTDAQIDTLASSKKVDPTYEVVAPIAGRVVEREVTPGELVSPDDESLMVLADLSTVWVLADVAEARLGEVGVGSAATLDVPALVGRSFEGTVTYVDPRVNENTRTARLRVEVANDGDALRPGMFARAMIGPSNGGGEAMPALPADAVMEVEGEMSVFVPVEGEPDTFARRAVRVGDRVGDFYPVMDGVSVGDEVVVAGTFILKADLGKAGASHDH